MHFGHIDVGDVIMVDIDGNVVPCTVLTVEIGTPGSIHLQDHGSSRCFWRSATSLLTCKRFDGGVTTYRGYSDYLKHTKPDVVVRFLKPAGTRAAAEPKPNKAERAAAVSETQRLANRVLEVMSPDALIALLTVELGLLPNSESTIIITETEQP